MGSFLPANLLQSHLWIIPLAQNTALEIAPIAALPEEGQDKPPSRSRGLGEKHHPPADCMELGMSSLTAPG